MSHVSFRCPDCDTYVWHDGHVCPPSYQVGFVGESWSEDIRATSFSHAAEVFAARHTDQSDIDYGARDVVVTRDGQTKRYLVAPEVSVSWNAQEIAEVYHG